MFNLQLFQVIVKFCLYLSVTKRLAYYMQFQFKSFRKNIWRLRPFTLLQIGFSHFEKINKTLYLNALYIYFYWYIWFYIAWHGCILYIQRLCPEISSPRAEAIYPWPWEDLVYVSYSIISNSTCIWLIPQPEHWQRKFW